MFGSIINLEKPLDATTFEQEKQYSFSYDDMSFHSHVSGDFLPNHIKFLRLVARSDEPSKLSAVQGSAEYAAAIVQTIKQAALMHKA